MIAVFLRELSAYFKTPIGYVYLAAFYVLAGYQFTVMLLGGSGDMTNLFSFLYTIVLLLTPVLTMRLLSEDRRQRTDQVLFSAPIHTWEIAAGKYLAASAVYLIGLLSAVVQSIVMSFYADVDWVIVFGNLVGIALMGMAAIALSMLISAFTENQIIAAIGGLAGMILVMTLNSIAAMIPLKPLASLVRGVAFYSRYHNLTVGLFRVQDLFFFLTFALMFLFLTVRVMEDRVHPTSMITRGVTIAGVIMVIAANGFMGQLSDRVGLTFDLTQDDVYRISADTAECLQKLTEDVDIYVMAAEKTMEEGSVYVVQVDQILKNFEKNSGRIKVEYVDLVSNPTFTAKYNDLNLTSWNILVESEKGTKVLAFNDLFTYDDDGAITASNVEQQLINAVLTVTAESSRKVTILTGYGDADTSDLVSLLESNQFTVTSQNLLTADLDPESATMILFAPTTDLEADSLNKLGTWLSNDGKQGRNLFVFLDPNYTELDRLEEYLEQWGIFCKDGYAFESNSNLYYEQPFYPVAQYGSMEYASEMTASDLTIMALCRPLEQLYESNNNFETTVLLQFTETSGILPLGATSVSEEDVTGNVNAMIMSTHSWYGTEVTRSRILVSGSALAFSSSLLTSSTFANGRYILNLFRQLDQQSAAADSITIMPKDMTQTTHTMTAAAANRFVWVFLAIIPAAVLISGIVIWLRRRHR